MFPLSTQAIFFLWISGAYLLAASCFAMSFKHRSVALIPAFGLVLWAIITINRNNGGGSYESLGDILSIGLSICIVGASAFFAFLGGFLATGPAPTLKRRLAGVLIVVVPALLVAGNALWKQYVPNATCSTSGIPIELGQSELFIPIEFAPRIDRTAEALLYRNSAQHKEDLRRICQLTRNGKKTAKVDAIWLSPTKIKKTLDSACSQDPINPSICKDIASAYYDNMRSIKLTTSFSDYWSYLKNWFKPRKRPGPITGGDMKKGFVCWEAAPPTIKSHCYIWQRLDDTATILVETGFFDNKSVADLQYEASSAIDYTVLTLAQ